MDEQREKVKRIKPDAEKMCAGCGFQSGQYCNWWRTNTGNLPPCQPHKPDEALTATYFNFSAATGCNSGEPLDPFFSGFACQTCGTKLAGSRHYCSATIGKARATPREKLEICVDCFQYFFT